MNRVFVEGYGCPHNLSDTEKLKALLQQNSFQIVFSPQDADFIIVNGCAVKKVTENRMLNRLRKLFSLIKDSKKKELIVFGCLAIIAPAEVRKISEKIFLAKELQELLTHLNIHSCVKDFSPEMQEIRSNKFVSILPISNGCLGSCSYCCVKNARGNLKSYSPASLNKKFKKLLKETKEIWLCAEDTGCYGKDINYSLAELLTLLLTNKGHYRIRVGMMNPQWLKDDFNKLLKVFKHENVYKFFHLPVQSGSNTILKRMNRTYSAEDFEELVKLIRKEIPEATISTDIIVGFPGETEEDFHKTFSLLKKTKPDIVNISRYDNRPNTESSSFSNQLHGREKKKRSRKLTKLCKRNSLENNRKYIGSEQEVLFSEKGKNNSLIGRALNYKPVVVKNVEECLLGQFKKVKIIQAKETYLVGRLF